MRMLKLVQLNVMSPEVKKASAPSTAPAAIVGGRWALGRCRRSGGRGLECPRGRRGWGWWLGPGGSHLGACGG